MNKLILLCIFSSISFFSTAQTWQKTYGGNSSDYGNSFQQTTDGGFIITGGTQSFGLTEDVYLVRTDKNGDTLWTKTYGGNNKDYGVSVKQAPDKGFIISGVTTSFGAGSEDIYLVKTDSVGAVVWTKTFGTSQSEFAGGVVTTADGGYCLTGSTGDVMGGHADVYLIKTDANGDTVWTKHYGGTQDDFGYALRQTIDNGFIISGTIFNVNTGKYDGWLIRTDSKGDSIWTRAFSNSVHSYANDVIQASDSGYVVAGMSGINYFIGKTDTSGNILWAKKINFNGADNRCYSVIESKGGFIMAGNTTGFDVKILLMKVDTGGNLLWTKKIGNAQQTGCTAILADVNGGLALVGIQDSINGKGNEVLLIKLFCDDFPGVSVSTNSKRNYCEDEVVAVLLSSTVVNAVTYQWTRNGMDIPGATTTQYTTDSAGSYNLIATNADGCTNSASIGVDVFISPLPAKPFIIKSGDTLSTPNAFSQYQWFLNDTLISGATNSFYVVKRPGTYKLLLTMGGCSTPSDDMDVTATGIQSVNKNMAVTVFPNPFTTSAILTITGSPALTGQSLQLNLYDVFGRTVFQSPIINRQLVINKNGLPAGIYFYKVNDDTAIIKGGKLVIQ